MQEFRRMKRLPPYVFAVVNQLKMELRRQGEDIIDLGMGNPDLPTPDHIVDKLVEAAQKPCNHRYSASRGITKLRHAISAWYARRYGVEIDPDTEAVVTIGVKEGLSHLVLATVSPGDVVLAPSPTYPIHPYSVIIAGGDLRSVPLMPGGDFFAELRTAFKQSWPQPKMIIISFPHNPTTTVVDLEYMAKMVDFCREHEVWLVHDFAYADFGFDGYQPPSVLQVPGAKEVAVEFFSMSKSYSMAGWRLGYCAGNPEMVNALTRIKSYLDYGVFQPIQIAAIIAMNQDQDCVQEIVDVYQTRRDHPGERAQSHRLGSGVAQGHHVPLGARSGALSRNGLGGIFQIVDQRGQGGGGPWVGFRRIRRRLRALRPGGKRAPHQPGGAGAPALLSAVDKRRWDHDGG